MSNGRGKHKSRGRRREKKISKGIHGGGGKVRLTELEKIGLGHGLLDSLKHIECRNPWRGVAAVTVPFDAAQAEINRAMYPHLFRDGGR